MIKSHIISCPICDHLLIISSPPQEIGGSSLDKKCEIHKHHKLVLRFNCCLELEKIILTTRDIKNLEFQWDAGNSISVLNRKTGAKFNLPWFEPDLYLYEDLVKKLKTYILFS